MRQRIRQLRNQIDEISGGEARFGAGGEDLPPEQEIAFLEQVIAFETAPKTTWRKRLKEQGYEMPDPAGLSEEAAGFELWQVIQRLAELHVYLHQTNHLADRELYERLYHDLLNQEVVDMPVDEDSAYHLDVTGSGSHEDVTTWLRYYAGPDERRSWKKEFPDFEMPPRRRPPHDRDRLLPTRPIHREEFHNFLDRLMASDWERAEGPIRLATDLRADEVHEAWIYQACRVVLQCLAESGKVKATAACGNLARAFVKKVFPLLPIPDREKEFLAGYFKAPNEEEIHQLHVARVICQQARLMHKRSGYWSITPKGKSLLEPARAGELYRALFIACFQKVSLAYFDRMEELPGIQATLPIILWRLSIVAGEWMPLAELNEATLIPNVLEEVQANENRPYSTPRFTLECRLWRHLAGFGLLETDQPDADSPGSSAKALRITPLFRRFIHFETKT